MPRILSLDAEEEILRLVNIILKRAGYEHLTTTNSNEALSILREGNIDLFTQSILRADINGCELYNIVRAEQQLQHIPILIISSLDPTNLPKPCSKIITALYPQYYITMPFSPKKLLTTIQAILAQQH